MAKQDSTKNKAGKPSKLNKDSKPAVKPVTEDARFKSVHNDPRFKFPNFKNLKVKVDDRFNKKELKKLNAGALGKSVKIDKYGRKLKTKDNNLSKFYEYESDEDGDEIPKEGIEEGEKEADENESDSESDSESESGSSDESDDESKDQPLLKEKEKNDVDALAEQIRKEESALDRARGEGLGTSSSSEEDDSSDSSSSSSSDDEDVAFEESESEIELEETKPEESDPTSSFAVVNMDWDNLRAEDLMATFASFAPKGGKIESVTIYPSEFGKERMQREEIEGPPKELFKNKKKKSKSGKRSKNGSDSNSDTDSSDESDSDLDSDVDINDPKQLEKVTRKLYEQDDGKEDYDSKALRRYQLQRLRYYYAVVVCDSVSTSQAVYEKVDGTEYESTANIFDLRYIPEGMEFDDDEAKDRCTKVPSKYRPDSRFVTDALQHSKVKLTWDETPKERLQLSSRPLSQKEIEENDFKAYLASDSDDDGASDGEATKAGDLRSKYQSLLGNTFQRFGKEHKGGDGSDDEDDIDMEITFDPGLKDAKDEQNEEEREETTIDAYKRKEKERRQRRLNKFKEQKEQTEQKEQEAVSERDQGNGRLRNKNKNALKIHGSDNQSEESFRDDLKSDKTRKGKKSKLKKGAAAEDDDAERDNFKADLSDPRFKEIFESHDFAIDPSNSEFKQTETTKKILQERANRRKQNSAPQKSGSLKHQGSNKRKAADDGGNEGADIKALAAKLKKKKSKQ